VPLYYTNHYLMKLCKFLLIVLLFGISSAYAQQDSTAINVILDKTKRLTEEQPIEKVYLHFDKPYYAVADTLWFKAYVTSTNNLPSPLSKIVYVEMYNSADSLIQTVKLPLRNSVAYGNIPLNMSNYTQGNYYVRAYTLWMLNSDPDYFFSKNILIGEAIDKQLLTNISYNSTTADKSLKTTARIQFRDINKKPLANKTVNWRIFHNYDVFARGKGTTDANGFLTVTVTSKAGDPILNGSIVADVSIAEKELASASFKLKQVISDVDFQLFPEGGELIAGIPNQVGFKAIKTNGLGIDVKGSVIDEQGTEISTFNSSFAGIGSFYISPEASKNYRVRFTAKDGISKTVDLQKASPNGIALQATNSTLDHINLKIVANNGYFEQNTDKKFYLVGQNTNAVCYAATLTLKTQIISVKIDKINLPQGITQFTLIDEKNEPVSERLVFVLHKNATNLSLKADLPTYKPRQKVKLSLSATHNAQPFIGDFSVAVTDETKVPVDENNETTILSSLLLTSDLKGYVEKPNYYFNKTDDKKLADLDRLMLTQGYRRFSFKEILANKYPRVLLMPEQGINISGTLRDLTGMPIRKGIMRMMVPGKPISAETVTSNVGVFNFKNLNFPDSSQVIVTGRYNPNYNNLMVMLDGIPSAAKGKNIYAADEVENIDTALSSYLANSQRQYRFMRTLKTVEIKASANVKRPSHADHPALSGLSSIPDRFIDGKQLDGCNLLLECIKMQAPSFTFDFNEQKFYITRDYNQGGRTPASIFLNGMQIDAVNLNATNAADVESIEIFLNDPLGTVDRMYNTRGVIVINTKKIPKGEKISKQALLDMLPKKYEAKYMPMGYSKEREFYSPKYAPNAAITSNDLRTTIYWNPKIVTDESGKTSFEFFNADGKGTYKAVIEGIDKDGNIGRTVLRYSVK
jgi:hypothetical protein